MSSVSVPSRVVTRPVPAYGWRADGKSAAEISTDLHQTRYRLEADVRALKAMLQPRRLVPAAALAGGLALLSALYRLVRRRRR